MDTLLSMRVFALVVETGSFTLAADRCHLSRPMVSKHVDHLESHLGTRLLHRTTRRLSLTESGKDYYDRCTSILSEIDEAEGNAAKLNQSPRGTLRLTMPISFSVRHMGKVLAEFSERNPEVRVELTLSDQRSNMIHEGLDLAIRIAPPIDSSERWIELATDRLIVCGSPRYFQEHGKPSHPTELAEHNCLLYTHSTAGHDWKFANSEQEFQVRVSGSCTANNGDILTEMVSSGAGLVRMPLFIVGDAIRSGKLQPIFEQYETEIIGIYAVPASKKYVSTKVRSFIEFLKETKSDWMTWTSPTALSLPNE